MKKILSMFIIIVTSLAIVSCANSIEDNTLSVVFYTGPGASKVDTVFGLNVGDKIPQPKEPTSLAGDFVAWYKDVNLSEEWDFENDTLSNSITLYAKWDYYNFKITYDLRGGEWPSNLSEGTYPTSYTYLISVNLPTKLSDLPVYPKNDPENPYKGLFIGWWLEPDLTAAQRKDIPKTESIPKESTGDITLYAYYSRE